MNVAGLLTLLLETLKISQLMDGSGTLTSFFGNS
jgi:hypothetical protein